MQRRISILIRSLLPFLFFLSASTAVHAANGAKVFPLDPDAAEAQSLSRPKIGLVLSGGGARGFAHIGVIRVLEEARVPIDVVVGTSMGSIVGGLYAMGLSPDEIEAGVKGIDWERVFDDSAQRRSLMYRRKQDDEDFFSIHRLGFVGTTPKIAPGLIEGQAIEVALDRLAHPAFHITDFDELRIPYRAVATNIENGDVYVISDGNLAKAMRASMSIPGALPPVYYGDTPLVDGGIANNIPVDIARELGADIVIVVDISDTQVKPESLESGLDITGQITRILTARTAQKQLDSLTERDILITPGRLDLTSMSFTAYDALIKEGEETARQQLDAISAMSMSEAEYAGYSANLHAKLLDEPVIDYVRIVNTTPLDDEIFERLIRQKTGEVLDVPQLEEDMAVIYGMDIMSSVVYDIEQNDGRTGLIVYVRYREWAPTYMNFGISIESEFDKWSNSNLSATFTNPTLNSLGGEFRALAQIGGEPTAFVELYQPLDLDLSWFVSAKTGFFSRVYSDVSGDNVDAVYREHRRGLELSAGKVFGTTAEARLGLFHYKGETDTVAGQTLLANDEFDEGGFNLRFDYDSLNNISFPTTGGSLTLTYRGNRESLGSDGNYDQAIMRVTAATTWHRFSLLGTLEAETSIDDKAPGNALFHHGGFLDISGTIQNELEGRHFGIAQLIAYQRVGNITFLPMYAGGSIETGNAWLTESDISLDNTILAGSLFAGADTFLGPIYLAYGFNDTGQNTLYLYIGKRLGDF